MKIKKSFGLLAAIAVVATAGWSYQQSKQYDGMSELALANVEALATGEGPSGPVQHNRVITDEIQSVEFLPHGVKTTYRRYCSWGGFQDCTSGIWTLVTPRY